MRLTLLSLVLLFPSIVFCQDSPCVELTSKLTNLEKKFSRQDIELSKSLADSLYKEQSNIGCERASLYYDIILGRYDLKKGQFENAENRMRKAFLIASDLEMATVQKHIRTQQALIKYENEDYEGALKIYEDALKIPCKEKDLACLKSNVKLKINSTISLKKQDKFDDAISNYLEAEQLLNEYNINDSIYKLAIHNGIGNIYDSEIGDKRASLESYQTALAFCPKNHRSKFSLFNNIASRYIDLNKPDSARYYYFKTINEAKIAKYLVGPYQGLGDMDIDNGSFNKAIENYTNAISNAEKSKNTSKLNWSKMLLGKAHFLNENHLKARELFSEVRKYYESKELSKSSRVEIEKYYLLNEIALKNRKNSLEMYELLNELDSLQGAERALVLNNSVDKYKKILLRDSLKNAELITVSQELKIKNQRLNSGLLAILSTLGLMGAFYFWRNMKTQESRNTDLVFKNDELLKINSNLESRLKTVVADIQRTENTGLVIQVSRKKIKIDFKDIKYVCAENNGSRFFMTDKANWTDKPLKEVHRDLPSDQFLKIFRGTIVNIEFVKEFTSSNLILKDGTDLKIGRSFKEEIQKIFEDKNMN